MPSARFWTGPLGDPQSEILRTNVGGTRLAYEVLEVRECRDYTQARIVDEVTSLQVWVNVWHRFRRDGSGQGVQWACIVA